MGYHFSKCDLSSSRFQLSAKTSALRLKFRTHNPTLRANACASTSSSSSLRRRICNRSYLFPKGDFANEASIVGFAERLDYCWTCAGCAGSDCTRVATKHRFFYWPVGYIQWPGISMYSGPHLPGRVGTTQRTCALEANRTGTNRFSNAYARTNSFTDSEPHSYTDTNPQTNSYSRTNTDAYWWNLRSSLERHHHLPWRRRSQCRQQQLHGGIL